MINSYINEDGDEIVVEENILYSSCKELSTFVVQADKSDGCIKNGFVGFYKIHIGQGIFQLLQHDTDDAVANWSVPLLKNFGYSPHNFFIKTGSRAITGAGIFRFRTIEGERIHQRLSQEVNFLNEEKLKSENNNAAGVVPESPSIPVDVIKSKPPAPPTKPRSIHLKNKYQEPQQPDYEQPQRVNSQQPSKKNTPSFGVPVLLSLTSQTSNLRVYDNVEAEPSTNSNNDSNGLGHVAGNHTDDDKRKLKLTRSVSIESSKSQSSRESKKYQKELKKLQKKKEEEEKKERKRREEEKKKEQKRKEEEEKKMKKELKKNKQKVGKRSSVSSQSGLSKTNCEYSEPDVFSSEYAEVSINTNSAQPNTVDSNPNTERIYSEPWGALPLISIPSADVGNEVEYAQPEKRPVGKTVSIEPRDIFHSENYSDVHLGDSEYSGPVVVRPNWEQQDDSNTELYSHLNNSGLQVTEQESVYGIASASEAVPVDYDENPYEDTSVLI
jgi:flagellar biosynthesis GTPase FlhF